MSETTLLKNHLEIHYGLTKKHLRRAPDIGTEGGGLRIVLCGMGRNSNSQHLKPASKVPKLLSTIFLIVFNMATHIIN